MQGIHRRRREALRFRPLVDPSGGGGPGSLEPRRLLSAGASFLSPAVHGARAMMRPHPAARRHGAHAHSHRVGPTQEINKQYQQFASDFGRVETSYVQSLNEQSSGTAGVSTTLTAPYPSGSATMQVADAAVFGPAGVFPTPVTATAMLGSVPLGTFILTGSSGNAVIVDPGQSSAVSLASGTTLTAQVTVTAASSAQAIFPTYISASATQLATNLVNYFNTLPIKLPRMYAAPHMPQRAGALQQYVYQVVAGSAPASLERTLMAVPLPQTPGSDLQIYDATVQTAIEASRRQMLNGVRQIFANKQPVIPIGSSASNGTPTSSTTSGSGTGSTASSGSTTSGSSTSVAVR